MRFVCLLILMAVSWVGCRSSRPEPISSVAPSAAAGAPTEEPRVIVTPNGTLTGRVARVNPQGSYAILSFPVGAMPSVNQHLGIYRNGLKVGEVKVTGPQRDYNIAGDLVAGQARVGDEVRAN